MGVETHPDTAVVPKPLDGQRENPAKVETMQNLGGDLLVSTGAGKTPAAEAPSLHPLTLVADATPAAATPAEGKPAIPSSDAPAGAPQMSDLERQQKAYDDAHGKFEKDLKGYWDGVSAAKKDHHFVMDFPPIYSGPDKPKVPGKPPEIKPNSVPTINQMLEDSKHLNQFATGDKNQPEFNLRQVGEPEFKQRYAQEALNIGKQYNLDKDNVRDIVRSIYAFEDGGWGTHETLSSMPQSLVKDDKPGEMTIQDARRNFHVDGAGASSALGYNQLLTATTMEKIEFQAQPIADRLNQLAEENPARAAELQQKAQLVTTLSAGLDREVMDMANAEKSKKPEDQKHYLDADGKPTDQLYRAFLNSKEPTAAGMTRQDMARAVHSLNLDGDIGPIIQAQELGNLLKYANQYGYPGLLHGDEQANKQAVVAYDALPADQKAKAVHDILDLVKPPATTGPQPGAAAGAATVAKGDVTQEQQFNATKKALEQKLLALQPGIDGSLSKDQLSQQEDAMLRTNVLTLRDFGENSGALSADSRLLLNKVVQSYYGGLTADKLMPAALELANLAGPKNAQAMIDAQNQDVPTVNFFSQAGYNANPVTNRRTGSELLLQIERIMRGPSNSNQDRPGQADFDLAFERASKQ
jgi:hypothetical protein